MLAKMHFIAQAVLIASKIQAIWDPIKNHCYWIEQWGDKAAIDATAYPAIFKAHSTASNTCD
jgi:quinol monooxygenase YgiN